MHATHIYCDYYFDVIIFHGHERIFQYNQINNFRENFTANNS